jgi:HSP20 family protein
MRYMIDFEKALNNIFTPATSGSCRTPLVDVVKEQDRYILEAELPGYREDEIDVKVNDGLLTISSLPEEEKKKQEAPEKSEEKPAYLIRERRKAPFSRSFVLPKDVESEKISGSFKNGVLTLTLEKAPEVKPRKITVKAA